MQLFISNGPHTITKNGKEVLLSLPIYNISDEKLMIENEFFKCSVCGNYFDKIGSTVIIPDKQFCDQHFPVIKQSED